MRTISILQAQAERDQLVKQIYDTVTRITFVDYIAEGKETVWDGGIPRDQFEQRAREVYERFETLCSAFAILDRTIAHARGMSMIHTSEGEMSILAAETLLEHRMGYGPYEEDGDFIRLICRRFREDYLRSTSHISERHALSVRDQKLTLVDILDTCSLAQQLEEKQQKLIVELETAIQTWRAVTMIEVP